MEEQNKENEYLEKGKFYLFSFVITIFLIGLLIINIVSLSKNNQVIYYTNEETTDVIKEESVIVYEIKEYNGKVCAFENGSLIYSLDTYVFTLPEKDQKLISEGIVTTDKNELYEILSEYY